MIPNTVEGEILKRKLRNDYYEYVCYVNEGYVRTKFHEYLCKQVQEFMNVQTSKAFDILLLSVPPQHGKSLTISETLPSWYLGNNPNKSVIITGYNTDFAEKFGRRNRDKFDKYHDIFRHASPNKNVQGVGEWETTKQGSCKSMGLRAGITGNPASLFIIDDPIKSMQEADSDKIVSGNNQAYDSEVRTRIAPGGKLIVIQTRWIENDTIGFVEETDADLIWKKINLPCECIDPINDPLGREYGEALINDKNIPDGSIVKRDNAWVASFKPHYMQKEGQRTWLALYQGMPSAIEGNLLKKEWWRFYKRSDLTVKDFSLLIMSVDAAFTKSNSSDPVAIQIWGIYNNNFYIVQSMAIRMTFSETCKKIQELAEKYPELYLILIEKKANGDAIIDSLTQMDMFYHRDFGKDYSKADNSIAIMPVTPKGGKYSRAEAVSPYIEAGRCYLPELEVETQDLVDECAKFPNARHDDRVDALSQALSELVNLIEIVYDVTQIKHERYSKWKPWMYKDYSELKSDEEQAAYIKRYGAPWEWLVIDEE